MGSVGPLVLFIATAVVYGTRAQNYGDLRLAHGSVTNSSFTSGRLEIYINGEWGTVCEDVFRTADANVACRQLGFTAARRGPIQAASNSLFGSGSGRIWLHDVDCIGTESHLLSCPNNGTGLHICGHVEDVAIYCSTAEGIGDLRLARGSNSSTTYTSGRLEIFLYEQWGTVCDDSFGITEADVACRQLGYSGASSSPITASSNSLFGSGSGSIWLDGVGCSGNESCLFSCSTRAVESYRCDHSEDVAIFCSGSRFSSTDCSFVSSACSIDEWRCNSGQCVSSYQRCDGNHVECSDGSDELNCGPCTTYQWRCTNGQCIPYYSRCDGDQECSDGSDELNCTCSSSQWRCSSGGQCISSHQHCDGTIDCLDQSDEFNCPCTSYQWRCSSGQCISSSQRCDGDRDCSDGSDELFCPCSSSQWRCNSGQCISSYQRCNVLWECTDGSDELNCSRNIACSSSQWRCSNGQCISSYQRCDGDQECSDGSDELNCNSGNSVAVGVGVSIGGAVLFVMLPIIVCVVIAYSIRATPRLRPPSRTVVSTCTPTATTTDYIITARRSAYQRVPTFDCDAPPPYTFQDIKSCPPPSPDQPPSQEKLPSQEQLPSQGQPPSQKQPSQNQSPCASQEQPPAYQLLAQTDSYSSAPQTLNC